MPWEFLIQDVDEGRRASCARTSMLHDGLKPGAIEALLRDVSRLLIGIRANLHAVIFVGLRRNNEGWEFFLLQPRGEIERVRFFCHCSYL
jgi:hypothetical protein